MKFAAMPRLVVCTAIVGAMVFAAGCAKKEEAQQAETAEPMTEEPATPAATAPVVAGVYMAQVGDAATGQKVTVTLNADNTGSVMVEYMAGQPAMNMAGNWAMGDMANAVNFTYDHQGAMMTMPMTIDGDMLRLGGEMATAMGMADVGLARQAAGAAPAEGAAEESTEGHSH